MGKTIAHRCPGCGGLLNMAQRMGYGAKCRKDSCPVQKVYIDKDGKIVDILYSTEPKSAPIALDQLRIMNEVMRI